MIELIKKNAACFKANLHCHSTISDGIMTPEELKEHYKSQGYNILAYTDHEVLVLHNELNDETFLTIPGYEVQIYGDMELPKRLRRVSHMNFYPGNPERDNIVTRNERVGGIVTLKVFGFFGPAES